MREKIRAVVNSRPDWFVYLFFLIITLVLTLPVIIQHHEPNYIDQMGHLFRVWFLTDAVQEGHLFPQWLPHWYSGMDTFRYYPPLSTYLMLPFNLIIDDPVDTYYIFGAVLIFATCITSYRLAMEFISRPFAVMAALLYTFSSLTIASYWFEGNFGRTLVAAIAPLVFLFAYRTLLTRSRSSFILLTVSTTLLVLGHGMQAAMTLLILAPWLLIIALFPQRRWKDLLLTFTGITLGIGLSLFWLLPANTHIDLTNVPAIYIDKILLFSSGINAFDVGLFHQLTARGINHLYSFSYGGLHYFSVVLVAMMLAGFILGVWGKLRWPVIGFFIAVFIGILLNFGVKLGDWYTSLPILKSFFPARFLLAALLPASILAGVGLQILVKNIGSAHSLLKKSGNLVLIILLVAFVVWDYFPGFSLVRAGGSESALETFSEDLPEYYDSGRVFVSTREAAPASYWPTVVGGMNQFFGYAIEGTIHIDTIPEMNKAIVNEDNAYLDHLFTLWQVNYALLSSEYIPVHQERFSEMGFRQVAPSGYTSEAPYILMARTDPLPPAFSFEQNVLAVGVGATGLNRHLPWIATGTSESLEDHDIEFLRSFDAIVLWEPIIKNRKRFEETVSELAAAGTDIYISPGRLVGDFAFGISSEKTAMSGDYRVENGTESSAPVDGEIMITLPADWYGHIYEGLDGTELLLETGEGTVPLLQYKMVEDRKVYFIGAAALCLLDTASVDEMKSLLTNNILARSNPETDPGLTPLTSQVAIGKDSMTVEITTEEDSWVILSESYSPSWRISLDGAPAKYQNLENMLAFYLTAGEHTLDFRYGLTPVQVVSLALSLLSLLVLLVLVFRIFKHRFIAPLFSVQPPETGDEDYRQQ